ncbi:uncharacterized protein LOC125236962 [Leguminivora glycinivorella]|uniref:uncharacterized protein LOC125236962 n=1 Tax=Leguminivora glycinivorella TaxID=1035111 RepID=UPI00200E78C4|nr:uncharacterized protein LOC125236962 [Leguminivora glycinivorella]
MFNFYDALCNENKQTNRNSENESQDTKHSDAKTSSTKILPSKEIIVPISGNKNVLTNDKNEPRDVNNILTDIASIGNSKNNTKSIEKIRHLVNEISKQNKIKHNVEINGIKCSEKQQPPKMYNSNVKTDLRYIEPITDIETKETVEHVCPKNPTKVSKNDQLVTENAKLVLPKNNIIKKEAVDYSKPLKLVNNEKLVTKDVKILLKHVEPRNETTKKQTVYKIYVKKPKPISNEDNKATTDNRAQKTLVTNTRRGGDTSDHYGNKAGTMSKDRNKIEIKEHIYEEELVKQPNTQDYPCSWYNGQNYNQNDRNRNVYLGNEGYDGNYYINDINYQFPSPWYFGDNQKYYTNSCPSNLESSVVNTDCTKYTKTILDRHTLINIKQNKELLKSVSENRKDIIRIESPDYYKNYYSEMHTQY